MLKRSETASPRAQPTSLADTTLNAEVVTPWCYHSTISQQSWQQSPHQLVILFLSFSTYITHIFAILPNLRTASRMSNVTGAKIFPDVNEIRCVLRSFRR